MAHAAFFQRQIPVSLIAVGRRWGERSGNCHFAGERTSIDAQGYLNGAVESGKRVSTEILADVKRSP